MIFHFLRISRLTKNIRLKSTNNFGFGFFRFSFCGFDEAESCGIRDLSIFVISLRRHSHTIKVVEQCSCSAVHHTVVPAALPTTNPVSATRSQPLSFSAAPCICARADHRSTKWALWRTQKYPCPQTTATTTRLTTTAMNKCPLSRYTSGKMIINKN